MWELKALESPRWNGVGSKGKQDLSMRLVPRALVVWEIQPRVLRLVFRALTVTEVMEGI